MEPKDKLELFKKAVSNITGYELNSNEINSITKDTKYEYLIFDLGCDSLDLIEIMMDYESYTGDIIKDQEFDMNYTDQITLKEFYNRYITKK